MAFMDGVLAQGTSGQLSDSQLWIIIAVGMLAAIYLAILRPMLRKRKDPLERAPAFASLSKQRDVERQMQNLLVELSEMARQISAQLDTRAQKLELLIGDADRKLAELKMALGNAGNAESSPPATSIEALPTAANRVPPDPRHADVYTLADQGRNATEIATDLHRPRGEVELILALRGKG
jgi:hypothetical protein